MNKELEAYMKENNLTPLKTFQKYREKDIKDFAEFTWVIKIIETALKNYEEMTNKPVILYGRTNGHTKALIDMISKNSKEIKITNLGDEKKLKALDVIKEKEVDIHNFKELIIKQEWTYEQYLDEENDTNTSGHQFAYKLLTQKEFNLLKEALL